MTTKSIPTTHYVKHCSKCRILKPLSNFHRNRSMRDGLHNNCKPCRKAYAAQFYTDNTELCLQRTNDYTRLNPEKHAEISARWREANPEQAKEIWTKANRKRAELKAASN